jgi:hypothetical protein
MILTMFISFYDKIYANRAYEITLIMCKYYGLGLV